MGKGVSGISLITVVLICLMLAAPVFWSGCAGKKVSLEYDHSPGNLVVELKTTGGIPTPWVDGIPDFRLYGDGRVIERPGQSGKSVVVESRLSEAQVHDLLSRIEKTGFFDLKPDYADRRVMDGVTRHISVNLEGQKKEVSVYMTNVGAFDRATSVITEYPLPETRDYVPDKGYLYVRKNQSGATSQPAPPEIVALLPAASELQQAAESGKPLTIPGRDMVTIRRYESGQKYAGLDVQAQGASLRVFSLYEPTRL